MTSNHGSLQDNVMNKSIENVINILLAGRGIFEIDGTKFFLDYDDEKVRLYRLVDGKLSQLRIPKQLYDMVLDKYKITY